MGAEEKVPEEMPAGKERLCLVTRDVRPVAEMVRFVVGPQGTVVPDIEGRLPGKGLWVTADRGLIETAAKKGRFKAAGGTAPATLADDVAVLLRERVLSLIGLSRRTGDLVAGFDALERAAGKGESFAFLVEATDGSPDGKRKLRGKLPSIAVYEIFDRAALSQATGRENTTHLGLKRSRLAGKIQLEMTRLAGLEGSFTGNHPPS